MKKYKKSEKEPQTIRNQTPAEVLRGLITHRPSKVHRWIKSKINALKRERKYRKRLKELRKKDPFIYK